VYNKQHKIQFWLTLLFSHPLFLTAGVPSVRGSNGGKRIVGELHVYTRRVVGELHVYTRRVVGELHVYTRRIGQLRMYTCLIIHRLWPFIYGWFPCQKYLKYNTVYINTVYI